MHCNDFITRNIYNKGFCFVSGDRAEDRFNAVGVVIGFLFK